MKIASTSLSNEISYCDMILFCTLWKDWQVPYLDMSIWEVSVGTGKKMIEKPQFYFYIPLRQTMLSFLSVLPCTKSSGFMLLANVFSDLVPKNSTITLLNIDRFMHYPLGISPEYIFLWYPALLVSHSKTETKTKALHQVIFKNTL